MIREDIGEALTQLRLGPGINEDVSEDYNNAVNMAIKALEQELQFLDAGYKNEAVEFHIGGRKFSVKELAQ